MSEGRLVYLKDEEIDWLFASIMDDMSPTSVQLQEKLQACLKGEAGISEEEIKLLLNINNEYAPNQPNLMLVEEKLRSYLGEG